MVLYRNGYGVTLLFAMGLVLVRRALALWGTMLAATGGTYNIDAVLEQCSSSVRTVSVMSNVSMTKCQFCVLIGVKKIDF
jgi:hypothetical protein